MSLTEKENIGYEPWNPEGIDPAMLTLPEYLKLANEHGKYHEDSAYESTIETLNQYEIDKSKYKLIRRFRKNGISFDLMVLRTKNSFVHRNPDDEYGMNPYLRDENNQLIPHTDEEIEALGYQPYSFTVSIFHGDVRVAAAQDEWGAMLIRVAKEYQRFGLGTIVGKIARSLEPGKPSGGFSPSGRRNFVRVHRELVRDALTDGRYREWVKSGLLTIEKVREIINSAKLEMRQPKDTVDYSSNNASDWMLYTDFHGMFVIYDRKLKDLYQDENHFTDNMVKGLVYVMCNNGIARIKQFGAQTVKLKAFMLALAYTNAKVNECALWVEHEEYDLPGFTYSEEVNTVGYSSKEVLSGPIVDYREMVDAERRFRKSFDQYDEFLYHITEYAHRVF